MKIVAISFGRKNKNCDIVAKAALMAAEKAGADVKFVNTMNMEISHCRGCGACSRSRDKGGQITCILKDDYLALEKEVLDADGIIVAAPVYSLAPTGQVVNFFGRFGAAHDLASATVEQEKRIAEGKTGDELLDARLFKKHYVAYISVGGAHTPNWVSMGLPNLHMFGMSVCMKKVGQIDAYDMGQRTNPLFDEPFMEKVYGLGTHLAEQIGKEFDDVTWYGDDGICPTCHNKLLSVTPGKGTEIECPLCGTFGQIEIVDGQVKVTFPESEQKRARDTMTGLYEHHYEIRDMMNYVMRNLELHKDDMGTLMKPFMDYNPTYKD